MIQIVPHLKVLVACEPVAFRKGIDFLACVCRQLFEADPFAGTLFVVARRRDTASRRRTDEELLAKVAHRAEDAKGRRLDE